MLNKVIFYQPQEYPEKEIILLENMILPSGEYIYCKKIEEKINEYIETIQLEITLFILEIEKNPKELYREPDEFAWMLEKNFKITEMNNTIILDGKDKNRLLNSYDLFEPIYKQQLENIYHFLKTNYGIDEYFRKKKQYHDLKEKFNFKNKELIKKI